MKRIRITPSIIPNMFTAMNMFCGFLSIINASEHNYIYASWMIIIAAIFDALDGVMARLTKSSSQLGVQLDSLSDVVSFGVAPAYLIYSSYLYQYYAIGIVISSLLMIAGGFRLARFNVQLVGFDKAYFTGLPIPSSALTIAAFVIAYYSNNIFTEEITFLIIPMVILLSYLMVSKIKYDSLPKFNKEDFNKKAYLYILPLLVVASLFFIPLKRILFFSFVFIVVFGIFRHIYSLIAKKS